MAYFMASGRRRYISSSLAIVFEINTSLLFDNWDSDELIIIKKKIIKKDYS